MTALIRSAVADYEETAAMHFRIAARRAARGCALAETSRRRGEEMQAKADALRAKYAGRF